MPAAAELPIEARGHHLSVVPDVPVLSANPYPSREEIFPDIPPELFIGDPLPFVVAEAYFRDVVDPEDFGFERWEFPDDRPKKEWIQISSRTLRQAPDDAPDPVRLYWVNAKAANGDRVRYEAETQLARVDGWESNRQDYVPTGMVRISGFSSVVDESVEGSPVMDAASLQFSYDRGRFEYASMLRSTHGTHRASEGNVPATGEVVSFSIPSEKKESKPKQLPLDDFAEPIAPKDEASEAMVAPSVRVDGNDVVMRHYGKAYLDPETGATKLQVIEVRAPYDINGLPDLIREQGEYDDDKVNDDGIQQGQEISTQDFAPMSVVYKAATQFPVSIKTTIIPVKS